MELETVDGYALIADHHVLQHLASSGDAEAQYQLGRDIYYGGYTDDHEEQGWAWVHRAALDGHAEAQYFVGSAYDWGEEPVPEDEEKASHWYHLAAEQGHAQAQQNLALLYLYGPGFEGDPKKAVYWYEQAAQQGDVDELCYAEALNALGEVYWSGKNVEEDREKALHYWRLALKYNYPDAQFNIGKAYSVGEGVEKDIEEAKYYWRLVAENENTQIAVEAAYQLGISFISDDFGLAKNVNAIRWLDSAANRGHGLAAAFAGLLTLDLDNPDFKKLNHYMNLAEQNEVNLKEFRENLEESLRSLIIGSPPEQIAKNQGSEKPVGEPAILLQLGKILEHLGEEKVRSYMNELTHKPLFQNTISELIDLDETQHIEFKESFSLNTRTGKKKDNDIREATLAEICGFLNSNDGVLLIGVRDMKNRAENQSAIAGIEEDGYSGDQDKYCRQINDLVLDSMGAGAASLVTIRVEMIDDKHVCRIECKKSNEPVYCNFKNKEDPYIRIGTSTRIPSHRDWEQWKFDKFVVISDDRASKRSASI